MGRCVYCNKSSDANKEISVHKFPTNEKEKQQWIQNIGWPNWTPTQYTVICSDHFEKNCIDKRDKQYRRRKGSIPTLFHNNKEKTVSSLPSSTQLPSEKAIKLEDDLVLTKRIKIHEVTVWKISLADKVRGMDHDHSYMLTPEVIQRHLSAANKKLLKLSTQNRSLVKKQKRSKLNINNLKDVVTDLQKSKQHPEGWYDINNFGDTACELIKRISKNINGPITKDQYPPQLRSFALTLHLYSPKAYDFVRESLSNALPHPSHLRSWCSSVDTESEFSDECLFTSKLKKGECIFDIRSDSIQISGSNELGK